MLLEKEESATNTAKVWKGFYISTSSRVYGPPYLSLAKSVLFGM